MARQRGIFPITGRLGNASFYKSSLDGYLVKTPGGPSREAVLTHPKFARTREINAEFTGAVRAAKIFRRAFWPFIDTACDPRFTSRLNGLMHAIKNLDPYNDRGARTVAEGLQTTDGKKLLISLQFTPGVALSSVLSNLPQLDTQTGTVSINGFDPAHDLAFPPGASHASIVCACSRFDFPLEERSAVLSNETIVSANQTAFDFSGTTGVPPGSSGIVIYILRIAFRQEIAGTLVPLKNKHLHCATVLGV